MKKYLLVTFFILVQGCASKKTRDECSSIDWQKNGYESVTSNFRTNSLEDIEKSCQEHAGVVSEANRQDYLKGKNEGLKKYCTKSHFFFRGELSWGSDATLCPEKNRSMLSAAYTTGTSIYLKKQRIKDLEKEMKDIENDKSFVADVVKAANVIGGTSPTSKQSAEIYELRKEIQVLVDQAPDSKEYCEYEMKQKSIASNLVPSFIMSLNPEAQQSLNSCSRAIK